MIPVRARIGATEWNTSLFPKDGLYVVPVKDAVRRAEGLDEGDNAILEGTKVEISPDAAGLLNETFKTDAVKPGLLVGIAKITIATK